MRTTRPRSYAFLTLTCAFTAAGAVSVYGGCSSSSSDNNGGARDAGQDRAITIIGLDDSGPQPWTPAALKPALWLDGDDVTLSGTVVARWADKSGNGNDALPGVNDDGGAPVPPSTKAFQGHQAVSFDGTAKMAIADAPSLQWGIEDFAFFAVVRYTGIADPWAGIIYIKNGSAEPGNGVLLMAQSPGTFLTGTSVKSLFSATSPNDAGSDDGRPHLAMLRRTGNKVALRLDRAPAGEKDQAPADISAAGATAKIGGQANIEFIKGDIALLIGIRGTVSDDDVAQMEAYVARRYAF